MKKLHQKIYMTAGYNTISMGTGRKEFNPKKERPGLEEYIKEAGTGVLSQIGGGSVVDECVVGNFMAERFNRQGHLAAFMPYIDESLRMKPSTRVEGACASGGLALMTGIRAILSQTADVVLALGVEVQNTVKALYCADYLAGAAWYKERKKGHAYFFPGQFSDRAQAYADRFGKEHTRQAMAVWYKNAIENARLCPTAQEYHNTMEDLVKLGMTEPNPRSFIDHLNVFDCSKVSDGASAITIVSEEGLKRTGIPLFQAVEVVGFGQVEEDITKPPVDLTRLDTTRVAVEKAMHMAGITVHDLATVECHDCFTIAAIMVIEALGLKPHGKGTEFILEGNSSRTGSLPMNTTGGLIGWGHPTGATGVHQAVTLWEQLTGKAGNSQINIPAGKSYGLSINMGGNDKTVVVIVYRKH